MRINQFVTLANRVGFPKDSRLELEATTLCYEDADIVPSSCQSIKTSDGHAGVMFDVTDPVSAVPLEPLRRGVSKIEFKRRYVRKPGCCQTQSVPASRR